MKTVLDLSRYFPGPLAGRILANIGFKVIRIGAPKPEPLEWAQPETFEWVNGPKETLPLDLKRENDRKQLLEMVRDAVLVLESNRPGVMEKLGCGPAVLLKENPKLAYVRIAGYREEEFHDSPGHDLNYLAADGALDRVEDSWKHMIVADVTGAMWAVVASLKAIAEGGGFYEVYLSECARVFCYPQVPFIDGSVLCYNIYDSADGKISIAALEPDSWERFCSIIGHSEWNDSAFTAANSDNAVFRGVVHLFKSKSGREWEQIAASNRIPLRAVGKFTVPSEIVPFRKIPI